GSSFWSELTRKAGSESGARIPDPQHFLSALALYLFRYPDRFIFYCMWLRICSVCLSNQKEYSVPSEFYNVSKKF
ncbi:MAG: hypothetical protein ACK559_00610, partial [bacterium]